MSSQIEIKNAGLVILSPYLPMLFERLGIVKTNQFTNDGQSQAIYFLQYIVDESSQKNESNLYLNKLLCGLELSSEVNQGIDISAENKILIEGLINAAISNWSIIENSTINGFRENWLKRVGVLSENNDHWELTIDKKPFDMLLDQLPFSFSIIKYPWMSKALHVICR